MDYISSVHCNDIVKAAGLKLLEYYIERAAKIRLKCLNFVPSYFIKNFEIASMFRAMNVARISYSQQRKEILTDNFTRQWINFVKKKWTQ